MSILKFLAQKFSPIFGEIRDFNHNKQSQQMF